MKSKDYKELTGLAWGHLQAVVTHWGSMNETAKGRHYKDVLEIMEELIEENESRQPRHPKS